MTKPQMTYIRQQGRPKLAWQASESKRAYVTSRQDQLAEFHEALLIVSFKELDAWRRFMASYVDELRKRNASTARGDPIDLDDPKRQLAVEVTGGVVKILEKVQDFKQLEARLQVPSHVILKAPPSPVGPDLLAVAIAVCQVLEIFIRMKRDGKTDRRPQ